MISERLFVLFSAGASFFLFGRWYIWLESICLAIKFVSQYPQHHEAGLIPQSGLSISLLLPSISLANNLAASGPAIGSLNNS